MRRAGILLHPSSLPTNGPCGDLGESTYKFLDWLKDAGIQLWQTLPLHPPGGGFSPYSSPSAFAGASYLISLDKLVEQGLLSHSEISDQTYSHRMDQDRMIKNILLQVKLDHPRLKDLLKHKEKLKLNKKVYLISLEIMHCS